MKHWEHRPEKSWGDFTIKQPYAKGLKRLNEEVLGKTDFDPATLWQWGTMQAMAIEEFISFFATVINRIVYASLEDPKIDGPDQVSFDILWCPHQDHYQAFDCRVQRYLVQGMLDALEETGLVSGFQVRFDSTIPAGAPTCHFTLWKASEAEGQAWGRYTRQLEEKALRMAAEEKTEK